ncbi:hypothetical protein [Larsenimonas suaedae]|uniref:DUF3135 domain-containing protein n=1 Tax=Larsenimonas suaedae TaxID=1851019 RepID=A0ABU1GYY2_9GAMM|nr:hypothetical protein [Larsenimonas suaedae]MCM2973731.1 hypothetical protein [Larsenimonas suaedae]MDR5897254.1 hypothetical protein [Larsenimonas suaedae]
MSQADIQEIELDIEQAKALIEKDDALTRLSQNPDFQKVIQEGYLKGEAVRLVHLKADPNMQQPDMQSDIANQITGIGCLFNYLKVIEMQAQHARFAMDEHQQTLNELMMEEGAE